jgi:hypothetical protein
VIEGAGQPGRAIEWPLYQGSKQLKAMPMTKASYCELRGWSVPADEDPAEVGYCVEYQDGGKPNLEGFVGYVSWSPADVFEKAYRPCGSHVDRMRIEYGELRERTRKLADFIGSAQFDALASADRVLLERQLSHMERYRDALGERLGATGEGQMANG